MSPRLWSHSSHGNVLFLAGALQQGRGPGRVRVTGVQEGRGCRKCSCDGGPGRGLKKGSRKGTFPSDVSSRHRIGAIAQNRAALQELGITHILNAAHSKQGSLGDQQFYGSSFVYYGVPAEDSSHFDLSTYFRPAARFIDKALKKREGKVLVHCIMGMSRSATLVLAYLMLYHRLALTDAIEKVIQKRAIYPNRNFLALLLDLDTRLRRKRRICPLL
uniref:Dual specificity protein phosphatase n=1 Tax=Scleropages formosus TaxID=113540 RepID=A0A8C9V5T7_SCLFO